MATFVPPIDPCGGDLSCQQAMMPATSITLEGPNTIAPPPPGTGFDGALGSIIGAVGSFFGNKSAGITAPAITIGPASPAAPAAKTGSELATNTGLLMLGGIALIFLITYARGKR